MLVAKNMQNLVIFMEQATNLYDIDLKAGNMCLNQFIIDEDAAFELSGVHYFKESWLSQKVLPWTKEQEREMKSKEWEYLEILTQNKT